MTNPRQLAPTVGPAHSGVEFLEGSLTGIKEFAIFQIRKNQLGEFASTLSSSYQILQSVRFTSQRKEIRVAPVYTVTRDRAIRRVRITPLNRRKKPRAKGVRPSRRDSQFVRNLFG